MLESALLILASYLWGAIPSTYLVARYVRNIDIRQYGSGNVGASNASEHLGRVTGFLLGVFDSVGKGTLPVVAAMLLDESVAVQASAGLAAVVGHNWSAFIGFTGGRGLATTIGVLLGFFMWREMLVETVIIGLIGRMLRDDTALWSLFGLLVLPLLAYVFKEPPEVIYLTIGLAIVLIVKRLTANWEKPRPGHPLAFVLAYRFLWDRDVPRREQWTARRPTTP